MNKWLYHAAGTAGIVGGFLLLGAGSAHAATNDDSDTTRPAPAAGVPELLPGLPALPLGDLDSLIRSLPLGDAPLREIPLDALGVSNGTLGTGGALTDTLAGGGLLRVTGDPLGLPGRLTDTASRTLSGAAPETDPGYYYFPMPIVEPHTDTGYGYDYHILPVDDTPSGYYTLPADAEPETGEGPYRTLPAPAPQSMETGTPTDLAGQPEIIGSLPFLTDPITRGLLGGQDLAALGPLATATNLIGQVPVAGPILNQYTQNLPLVGAIIPSPESRSTTLGGSGGGTPDLTGPVGDDLLEPVIAQRLVAEGGYAPDLLGTAEAAAQPEQLPGVPLIGPALEPLSRMFGLGVGNIANQIPLLGPLAGPLLNNLPVVGGGTPPAGIPAPGTMPGVAGMDPAAAERPIAGDDPEFTR